jgi:peroxiredoxin (alkyl hydroperoxide reductase subunit C)
VTERSLLGRLDFPNPDPTDDAMSLRTTLLFLAVVAPVAAQERAGRLGPRDTTTFAPTDTGRVTIGSEAPDFTLEALTGPPVTLSQFRGKKNVVLVFYRGHW